MLITQGDLMEQESKIAGSGLADYFMHIEIVSAKSTDVYRQLFDRHQIDAKRLLMIGNSLPSDVLPIVELGGIGVHIPYQITWKHERVQVADAHLHGYHTLQSIRDVPALVRTLVHGIQG